jgi:peptidyl-tRNA hydrolase
MRVEQEQIIAFRIHDAPNLDPVLVIIDDRGSGKGRLIVECAGAAWSAYWNAMGDDNSVAKFVMACEPSYIAGCLTTGRVMPKHMKQYVLRLVKAVQEALKLRADRGDFVAKVPS